MEELTKTADALMAAHRWDEAEELLTSRMAGAAAAGNTVRELSLCSELLGFYRMRGDPERFFAVRERTDFLLENLSMPRETRGTILVNEATGLVAFGRPREALEVYGRAEVLLRSSLPRGDFRVAALYNNMSSAWAALKQWERAENCLLQAMDILRVTPFHPDVATSWVNLAQLYAASDPEDGRVGTCLDRAMDWLDQPEMRWDDYYAHTAEKCAGGFEALGRPKEAAELRERAEWIHEGT